MEKAEHVSAQEIRDWLAGRIAKAVGADPADIDRSAAFDAHGINSTDAVSISGELEEWLRITLSPTVLYEYPTIGALAAHLTGAPVHEGPAREAATGPAADSLGVVGVACRFPGGANTPAKFWSNLTAGVDASTEVPADRWDAAAMYSADPGAPGKAYTKSGAFVSDIAGFDPGFFRISPREALRMDPQQRMLLETAWAALEDSGIRADGLRGCRVGVFVGMMASDQYASLQLDHGGEAVLDDPNFGIGTASSVASGRLSYQLDLRGPSVTLDTACSSALVAVHLAAESLNRGECDLAVVCGVSATLHEDVYRQACKMRMLARDGRCKTFDREADGFVLGEGCGVVVLERVSDAAARGHRPRAVLRGSAINQDGASNGLTAPNRHAQAAVIRAALGRAGVCRHAVGYIEGHGSGTLLGDSIEMAALQDVFGPGRPADHPLVVGAVKTNIGHLVGAAGIAGLIKAVLAVQHGQIPPNLHLSDRNPTIDWSRCPTVLPAEPMPWPADGPTRIAGVSSFGWSGSNAHVVLEQQPDPPAPDQPPDGGNLAEPASWQLLPLSASTGTALREAGRRLRDRLAEDPAADLADVAFTLQTGRSALPYRAALTCRGTDDARAALAGLADGPPPAHAAQDREASVAFLLPGSGDQYPGMGAELHRTEPVFRDAVDECAALLAEPLGLDLRTLLYPPGQDGPLARPAGDLAKLLGRTVNATGPESALFSRLDVAHAAVFTVDYACALLWRHWGVRPSALLGYSLGEYVAACIAGVFTLEDALTVVVRRAKLIQSTPGGAMLAVAQPAERLGDRLGDDLSLAAVNGPLMCVVAGASEPVAELGRRLADDGIACRQVPGTHAMHSALLDPLRAEMTRLLKPFPLREPDIPFISNVTGTWISAEQARDPGYWAGHMCSTVQFASGVAELAATVDMLLETGPGRLTSLATQVLSGRPERTGPCVPSLRAEADSSSDRAALLRAAGRLWASGVQLDWARMHERRPARIVSLPTYPFEHQRFWPAGRGAPGASARDRVAVIPAGPRPADEWLYVPGWKPSPGPAGGHPAGPYLIFGHGNGLSDRIASLLDAAGATMTVVPGTGFAETAPGRFTIRPGDPGDHTVLLEHLSASGRLPRTVVHLWGLTGPRDDVMTHAAVKDSQQSGFTSVIHLGRAVAAACAGGARILVVTDCAGDVDGTEHLDPGKSTVIGPVMTLPQEYPGIGCRWVDVETAAGDAGLSRVAEELVAELRWPGRDAVIAYRAGERRVRTYQQVRPAPRADGPLYRDEGVYLITGGLGKIGMLLARHINANTSGARFALISRTGLPPRGEWDGLLSRSGDDPSEEAGLVAGRIRHVLELEAAGAAVEVYPADLADPARARELLARIHERFGPVNGVIHAAGLTSADSFATIETLTPQLAGEHFAAKVYGTLGLIGALTGEPLDFCVVQSSMSAVLGGLGFTAYAAANAFLDHVVAARNRAGGCAWQSVSWDTWRSTGGTLDGTGIGASMAQFSLSDEDGLRVFDQVLTGKRPQLVVSTGELEPRVRTWLAGSDPLEPAGAPTPEQSELFPRPGIGEAYIPAGTDYERRLAGLWRDVLGIEEVGVNDNFFELGGNSLVAGQLVNAIRREFHASMPVVALFEAPTVAAMARYLRPDDQPAERVRVRPAGPATAADGIAVIGMAGRYPGAKDLDQFWHNLSNGIESISFFTEAELIEAGVPAEVVRQPGYVMARPVLDDVASFDAEFFGYNPWEARLTDPQHRIFLECVWEALENSGYAPRSYQGAVGVFAGANISTYLRKLYEDPAIAAAVNDYQVVISNDKDALTTTASYKLNLRGPSVAVQTFCSTSLVATHLACRSLADGECDIALAGGVSVRVPDRTGHLYQEGGMESPDGHVRTFDAAARGALFGDGAGVVVLKRLSAALADGDTVLAVIRGSAINNDGSLKVGFTAPSVGGQAEVVSRALAAAGVDPASISYVEAHGTATELGDPIEVAALTKAFGAVEQRQYCAIGSVKTNVGHLDRAAGVTGLIKTVLSLRHRQIPPSLHYTSPNPEIDFKSSPFYVNAELADWVVPDGVPRRAGVTSLGMGGTNAHLILEEAPPQRASVPTRAHRLLLLSARDKDALAATQENLRRHLSRSGDAGLADTAYTLQVGRESFEHRAALVCQTADEAIGMLDGDGGPKLLRRRDGASGRPVGFVLAGVGEQYPGMAATLYRTERSFRETVDACAGILQPLLGVDVRDIMLDETARRGTGLDLRALLRRGTDGPDGDAGRDQGPGPGGGAATGPGSRTSVIQPAVFAVEYALARQLMEWGIRPQALLGYSLGEYVAACLAGVFPLEDALRLVAERARLIEQIPPGAMLAVALPAGRARPLLGTELDLAALNSPGTCVVAGPVDAVAELHEKMIQDGIAARRLDTTHAFHSRMLEPVAARLTAWIRDNIRLTAPRIPYVSNVTGAWIEPAQATDPSYWARHMCEPVRFADGAGALLAEPGRVLVEIGLGGSLSSLIRQHPDYTPDRAALIIPTLPARHEPTGDQEALHTMLARLWLCGATIDWQAFHAEERLHRVPLPTYPFQRRRYWIDTASAGGFTPAGRQAGRPQDGLALPREEPADWFYLPVWRQSTPPPAGDAPDGNWLIFADQQGTGAELAARLESLGAGVVTVRPGDTFACTGDRAFTVRPGLREDYLELLGELGSAGIEPGHIVHLWAVDGAGLADGRHTFYSLMHLAQAIGDTALEACTITTVSADAYDVTGGDRVNPDVATLAGPAKVIPYEYPGIDCRLIDVARPAGEREARALAGELLRELGGQVTDKTVALRRGRRWLPAYERLSLGRDPDLGQVLRQNGVYLITGGLGGIGSAIAMRLARSVSARLVLVGRSGLPDPASWDELLGSPDAPADLVRRIGEVRALRSAGAEVMVLAADVSRPEEVEKAVAETIGRFGRLDGVIHAAGLPGVGLTQFKSADDAARTLAPKVGGARALCSVLADAPLDFLVLFSSTSSITGGGPGQIDYCAANAYLDSCANAASVNGPPTLSISWGEWQWNAWEEALDGFDEAAAGYLRENRSRVGITFDEGWHALLRALAAGHRHVIVSSQDFPGLLEGTSALTAKALLELRGGGQANGERHPRPDLSTPYSAPDTDLTRQLAALWAGALGLAEVGVHDSFFELGGNSLLGLDLTARIQRTLRCGAFPPHVLYEAPTVASLAEYLRENTAVQQNGSAGSGAPADGGAAGANGQSRSRGSQRREHLRRGTGR